MCLRECVLQRRQVAPGVHHLFASTTNAKAEKILSEQKKKQPKNTTKKETSELVKVMQPTGIKMNPKTGERVEHER